MQIARHRGVDVVKWATDANDAHQHFSLTLVEDASDAKINDPNQ